jgi:DNA-binding NarL/FixJ family response regulator
MSDPDPKRKTTQTRTFAPPATKRLRILLADDHKLVREGLAALINTQPDMQVVGEAADGGEAVQKSLEVQPEVVIMDLSMPQMNGLLATEALHAKCPGVKVLVLTMHEDDLYLRQMCKANALGYVLKRSAAEELIKAIRAVAAGDSHFDARLANRALARQSQTSNFVTASHTTDLSDREKEVLKAVAWGYSNKEIAAEFRLSVKTVETYKMRVAEKLRLRSRTDMVQYALRHGWLSEMQTGSFLDRQVRISLTS